jgi:CDP-6-deoxy-D-xylo-4-hexulose-3-dehydrase
MRRILESIRDWGRDCWCAPGKENTCGKRFQWQLGKLPRGYDHKYIYSQVGFNPKATDLQAAIGLSQLKKIDGFIAARKRNFSALRNGLQRFEEYLILPEATPESDPAVATWSLSPSGLTATLLSWAYVLRLAHSAVPLLRRTMVLSWP